MRQHRTSRRELVEQIERQARAMRDAAVLRCAAAVIGALRSALAVIVSYRTGHDLALRRRP